MIILSTGYARDMYVILILLILLLIVLILQPKFIFKLLAQLNKIILPSFIHRDLSQLKKYEKLIIAYRYWITKKSL